MTYVIGFIIWLVLGIAAGLLFRMFYRGPTTTLFLAVAFGIFGAFIGGMLGVGFYVTHDPSPVRFGGMVGAVFGATLFSFVYNVIARKAL